MADTQIPPLSKTTLFLLALCAGGAVANLYYAQPLLAVIGHSFNAPTSVGLVSTATQLGYTLGIFLLLPLGDLVDRRRLTLSLAGVLFLAMLACAMAPSLPALMAASLVVGVGAIITQIMVPLATDLARPEQRAHAVGVVFSGILAGILLARTVSGLIGQALGWRPMFLIAAAGALGLGAILFAAVPKTVPKTRQTYGSLLVSMLQLFGRHRTLRYACGVQACLFSTFTAFWTILALLLARPPFNLGPAIAGAFGLVGLVGVAAANRAGRIIDRFGAGLGLRIGVGSAVAAWVVFALFPSIIGLIAGVLLLDFGISVANVSNQSTILGIDPEARSRINTLYVTALFIGGSLGSAGASFAWGHGGWTWVCAQGLLAACLAVALLWLSGRDAPKA